MRRVWRRAEALPERPNVRNMASGSLSSGLEAEQSLGKVLESSDLVVVSEKMTSIEVVAEGELLSMVEDDEVEIFHMRRMELTRRIRE